MCSRTTLARLTAIPEEWIADLKPRRGSAVARLILAFYDNPVMSQADTERHSGASEVQTYRALSQRGRAGFIQEITGRKRDRVWAAAEVLAELDDLDRRIQESMRNQESSSQ